MTWFDAICFLLLAAIVAYSVHKGFVWVIMRLAAVIVSLMLARLIAPALSDEIYTRYLFPRLMPELRTLFENGFNGTLDQLSDELLAVLPTGAGEIAQSLGLLPIHGDALKNVLSPDYIEQAFVEPIITKLVLIITTLLLFVLFSSILKIIIHFINKKFFEEKHGVISNINRVFGGVFGLLRGAVTLSVFVQTCLLLAPLLESPAVSDAVSNAWITGIFSSILI